MIPLSLYIHIPWCEKKCPYCDFNSHQAKDDIDEPAYINALLSDLNKDLEHYRKVLDGRTITSIFIGGGTPSLFSSTSIAQLLESIEQQISFTNDIEITLEANPSSSEINKFTAFRAAGINRLSIGVQSFNPTHLQSLGRVHSSQEALSAGQAARAAGFDNFNLDLMFGLPKQSLQQSLEDLEQALALKPTHLSCYQLTIEPNTLFHSQPPVTPSNETLWAMQNVLQEKLQDKQYHQYEVSAYSQINRRCQHNLNYWQFGDYLGIGAGAHGKISSANGQVERSWKIKHPASYIEKQDKLGERNLVAPSQLPFEFLLNALRLTNGFDLSLFEKRTFQSIDCINEPLQKHLNLGLLERKNDLITPTDRGKQMLDSLLQDYL